MSTPLTLALSKGRIFDETLPLLAKAGIHLTVDPQKSRKLVLPTNDPLLNVLILRATDVPTFVAHGAADLGVAGKDVLLEHGAHGLYEPLDLQIARCRMMVAAAVGTPSLTRYRGKLKVATKFVNITERYFAEQGRQVEIVKLYGSMELAPLVGLASHIVDVVDTGNTLRANGLEPTELIFPVSARLVVNVVAMKTKHARIAPWIRALESVVVERAASTRVSTSASVCDKKKA